jgi:hypothetical protein
MKILKHGLAGKDSIQGAWWLKIYVLIICACITFPFSDFRLLLSLSRRTGTYPTSHLIIASSCFSFLPPIISFFEGWSSRTRNQILHEATRKGKEKRRPWTRRYMLRWDGEAQCTELRTVTVLASLVRRVCFFLGGRMAKSFCQTHRSDVSFFSLCNWLNQDGWIKSQVFKPGNARRAILPAADSKPNYHQYREIPKGWPFRAKGP